MTVKFAHIRAKTTVDKLSGVATSVSNRGGYTIAFRQLSPRKVQVALARCNPKDNFNKALGRTIAEGRLNLGNSFVINTRATKYANIVKAAVQSAEQDIAWEKALRCKSKK